MTIAAGDRRDIQKSAVAADPPRNIQINEITIFWSQKIHLNFKIFLIIFRGSPHAHEPRHVHDQHRSAHRRVRDQPY